ncbi:exodeoxyribonuclease VII large subunit [Roseibium sp.]|uniref:exodeoxyribonuclease VII large subunit n=1 Tax=Roseibium sp. TaxID=1936156 RepID=UPI003D0D4227
MSEQQTGFGLQNGALNAPVLSVSEISGHLKRVVEDSFSYVRVRGEISGFKQAASGHMYFRLKDEAAVLDAVCWRGTAGRLSVKPEDGLEVIATGRLTTYPGRSNYQIVVESVEVAGEGALLKLLEDRRKALSAEGLFDLEAKRPLPFLPRVIGVVTSPTGAVIRDILHRIDDRFPLHVLVWPVRVQGETSGAEVANGIRGFNTLDPDGPIPRPDVLIVARGGGSIEDLWGFNEEAVVRAAADSQIPLISAVGHETDWTLIDLAADVRAPTPTGAAEIAVPVKAELMAMVDDRSRRLNSGLVRFVTSRRTELRAASAALPAPQDLLALPRQKFDTLASSLERSLIVSTRTHRTYFQNLTGRLSPILLTRLSSKARQDLDQVSERQKRALTVAFAQKRQAYAAVAVRLTPAHLTQQATLGKERLTGLAGRLDRAYLARLTQEKARVDGLQKLLKSLSYKDVLARGYAVVRDDSGQPVRSAAAVSSGAALSIELADGSIDAVATSGGPDTRGAKPKRKKPDAGKPVDQGSLF